MKWFCKFCKTYPNGKLITCCDKCCYFQDGKCVYGYPVKVKRKNKSLMTKWQGILLKADTSMTQEARKFGKARLTINYYSDRNNVVRKVMERGGLETQEVYDRDELDD